MSNHVMLPKGSYLLLHAPLNIPGLGSTKQWTSNELKTPTANCVQHIVRDDHGYNLCVPSGAHAGWYHVPFTSVQFCRIGARNTNNTPVEFAEMIAKRREEIEQEANARLAAEFIPHQEQVS